MPLAPHYTWWQRKLRHLKDLFFMFMQLIVVAVMAIAAISVPYFFIYLLVRVIRLAWGS